MKKLMNAIFTLSLFVFPGCKWFSCSCPHDEHSPSHTHQASHEETGSTVPATTPVPVQEEKSNQVIKVSTNEQFEELVIGAKKPALVDFSAKWCGPCQTMKPIVEELAQEMGSQYLFVEVNVDAASDVANKYNIKGIPTFTFFKNGKEVVNPSERLTGAIDKKTLKAALEKNLG